MAFTIRQYEQGDLEPCRSLWFELTQHHQEIYEDTRIGGKNPGLHFDKHLSKVGDRNNWVAERNSKVVGMVGLMRNYDDEVEPLVVTSGCRNRGAGSALLEHVIERARNLGIRFLSIRPVARNLEATSLFHSKWFDKLGQIETVMYLQDDPRILWKPGPEIEGHSFKI